MKKTSPPTPAAPGLLSLSYEGKLPEILRLLAEQIDAGRAKAERVTWNLTEDRLEFGASLDMRSGR
jgi:hypothetical protein